MNISYSFEKREKDEFNIYRLINVSLKNICEWKIITFRKGLLDVPNRNGDLSKLTGCSTLQAVI